MTSIGIIGAGVAGVQLGLFLRQYNIDTTIYAERSPEQQFASRLPSLVARMGPTRERERKLGVNHWDNGNNEFQIMSVRIPGEHPLAFQGNMTQPMIAVDMRIYLGRLLEDFAARGGKVVVGPSKTEDVERLSEQHDLIVVAVGRGAAIDLFPRIEEYSPFSGPQRVIATGIFRGVARTNPATGGFTIVPGHGEIFDFPFYSFEPNVTALGVEAVPGGAFEAVARMRYEDDPAAFNAALLELIREYAPALYARIDPDKFGLTRPLDLLQGGVTPAVRHGYARLSNGKFALAIGDANIANDPITGQGANTASYVASLVSEIISKTSTFDEAFCKYVGQRIWEYAGPIAAWSNGMLMPPPEHIIGMLVAAAQHQPVADAFVRFFEKPNTAWGVMSSPESTAAFLAEHGWQPQPEPELVA